MKNLFIILIAFVLVMSGCSKKSDPKPVPSLLGTWYVTKSTVSVYQNNVLVSTQDSPGDRSQSITFNSDNSGLAAEGGFENSFKYTLSDKSLAVTFSQQNPSDPPNIVNYTIKAMTAASLTMSSEWGDVSYKETTDLQLAR